MKKLSDLTFGNVDFEASSKPQAGQRPTKADQRCKSGMTLSCGASQADQAALPSAVTTAADRKRATSEPLKIPPACQRWRSTLTLVTGHIRQPADVTATVTTVHNRAPAIGPAVTLSRWTLAGENGEFWHDPQE